MYPAIFKAIKLENGKMFLTTFFKVKVMTVLK